MGKRPQTWHFNKLPWHIYGVTLAQQHPNRIKPYTLPQHDAEGKSEVFDRIATFCGLYAHLGVVASPHSTKGTGPKPEAKLQWTPRKDKLWAEVRALLSLRKIMQRPTLPEAKCQWNSWAPRSLKY